MTVQPDFRGNFVASGAKTARLDPFGTPGLSGVSDFATHPDEKPRQGMTLKKHAIAAALVACASPALAESLVESLSKYSRAVNSAEANEVEASHVSR